MNNKNIVPNINNLDISSLKQELIWVFKSPNPISIYMKSKQLNDTFSCFLNQLSQKISDWFTIKESEKTFVSYIYKNTNYQFIWAEVLESFLRESRNFDLLSYLYFSKNLNNDKMCLSKWLLWMYKKYSKDQIITFLENNNATINLKNIEDIYIKFEIEKMSFWINLREDFDEHFIEKIYLNLPDNKRNLFLDNFILKFDKNNVSYDDMSKVLMKVVRWYTSIYKRDHLTKVVNSEYFSDIKISLDNLLKNYPAIIWSFYVSVCDILRPLWVVEKWYFWQYIKTYIIDNYYPEVRYLFYWYGSSQFLDKNTYTKLKWTLNIIPSISPEADYLYSEINEISDFKQIILELNDNLFSFFLLPIVYNSLSEKLTITKWDLYKMKYLLLYIFSDNYNEYKKIYMFFNQLEIFLNYDKKAQFLDKIQVCFSIIFLVFLSLIVAYFYLPIWVFLWILILSLIKFTEVIYPNFYFRLKINSWLKFFATMFLVISSYFWILNFDKVKEDTQNLTKQIEFLWKLSSKEVIDKWAKYIKASILDRK